MYGQCPRVYCRGHPLLPVGLHDRTKQSTGRSVVLTPPKHYRNPHILSLILNLILTQLAWMIIRTINREMIISLELSLTPTLALTQIPTLF